MSFRTLLIAAPAIIALPLFGSSGPRATDALDATLWASICHAAYGDSASAASWLTAESNGTPRLPVATCAPIPQGYHTLSSIGTDRDTTADLKIGYDPDTHRLCFTGTGLPEAPVLRVGVGHTLSIRIANTLRDSHVPGDRNVNCPIDEFGGEGLCENKPLFREAPGVNGAYYPIEANEAHNDDGTSNLHVHGLFVSPAACSDEVLASAIYPANWRGPTAALQPCQKQPDTLTYTYQLPADHPAGVYWYHTHRHGQAEHQTQMGLVGAIVVEDRGDAYRKSIGVTDEVLLVTDTPNTACLVGPSCDVKGHIPPLQRQAARAAARGAPASVSMLDPRIDEADEAGECAHGASGPAGGVELWTLLLNGAQVPENAGGFPPDSELLTKTMAPGQRQIFRLVNASANSFLAPQLVLSQGGVETIEPLEVFARDGVGIADAAGRRHFQRYDVASKQLVIPPAGRVEFVVHAPPPGATLYLQSSQVLPGCGGNAYPARRLLVINAAGAPVDPGDADDDDLLRDTPSLAPYLSTLGATASVHRIFVLSEYGRDFTYGLTDWLGKTPTQADYDPSQTDFFITEVASDDGEVNPAKTAIEPFNSHNLQPQVIVHLHGQPSVTEEWEIQNATLEIHAFHMHQVHFQRVSASRDDAEPRPLLDTITVPAAPLVGDVATGVPGAPGVVKLRMTFTTADIGEFVFHCHILEHEDNGMMGKIRVVAD